MESRLKVMTVLGTRPEIIRLSEVIKRLDAFTDHVLVHTGQNYDYQLSQVFFDDLGVREPDHFLDVRPTSVGHAYGEILIRSERVMQDEAPDAVLVLGDTNSAISAVIARRLHIPVYHMEAGNRSFDANVPEEVNRRIVDHVADFNMVYTERSRQHLLAEGLPARRIYLTGSPLREVWDANRERTEGSTVVQDLGLEGDGYFLVSLHREETVDSTEQLGRAIECLNAVAEHYDRPVIVSTHPRTRHRLDALSNERLDTRIQFHEPFGYFDYNRLQLSASCVLSDSGSVSEESAIMGFPAVTLRESMERPEALDAGSIVLTGLDAQTVVAAVELQRQRWQNRRPSTPPEYQVSDTSERAIALILGTARLGPVWSGVRSQ